MDNPLRLRGADPKLVPHAEGEVVGLEVIVLIGVDPTYHGQGFAQPAG